MFYQSHPIVLIFCTLIEFVLKQQETSNTVAFKYKLRYSEHIITDPNFFISSLQRGIAYRRAFPDLPLIGLDLTCIFLQILVQNGREKWKKRVSIFRYFPHDFIQYFGAN